MTDDMTQTREAAVRALQGETDVRVILPAFRDRSIACALALAPIDPLVRSVASIASGVSSLQEMVDCTSPALSDALRWFIGRDEGDVVLQSWASAAPPRWGTHDAHALGDAVRRGRCAPWVFAALVGPEETPAAYLCDPRTVARAIRCWGRSVADDPTWWTRALSPGTLERFIAVVQTSPFWTAFCWPWLPNQAVPDVTAIDRLSAVRAFRHASDAVRLLRADDVRNLLFSGPDGDDSPWVDAPLESVELIVASRIPEFWQRLSELIRMNPEYAEQTLICAPWNDLPDNVRSAILAHADADDRCAAIAYACGERDHAQPISRQNALSFFAAVTRQVWDRLPHDLRQEWIHHLPPCFAHIAVRSLGNLPGLLACAVFGDDIIAAVRRHATSAADVQSILFPVAMRSLEIGAAYAMLSVVPHVDDHDAFAVIARGSLSLSLDPPPALPLRGSRDIAAHVTLWRMSHGDESDIVKRCAMIESMFTGRSWDDAQAMLSSLGDERRQTLFSVQCGATESILSSLPPGAALPALHAVAAAEREWDDATGQAFSFALRHDGMTFLAAIDAMDESQRAIVLPIPPSRPLAAAIRALAACHPHSAWQIANALNRMNLDALVIGIAAAPHEHRIAVWNALTRRQKEWILHEIETLTDSIVAAHVPTDERSDLARACAADVDLGVLIRLLARADETAIAAAITLLEQRPSLIRHIAPILRPDLRRMLEPRLLIHFVDVLPDDRSHAMEERRRRRRYPLRT